MCKAQVLGELLHIVTLDEIQFVARRGVDGVTVREIVAASGQKNHGSLTYYFGSKEELVRELVARGHTVVSVLQKGYTIADRVLRPALVTVTAPK